MSTSLQIESTPRIEITTNYNKFREIICSEFQQAIIIKSEKAIYYSKVYLVHQIKLLQITEWTGLF